jgi:hypothetical protein
MKRAGNDRQAPLTGRSPPGNGSNAGGNASFPSRSSCTSLPRPHSPLGNASPSTEIGSFPTLRPTFPVHRVISPLENGTLKALNAAFPRLSGLFPVSSRPFPALRVMKTAKNEIRALRDEPFPARNGANCRGKAPLPSLCMMCSPYEALFPTEDAALSMGTASSRRSCTSLEAGNEPLPTRNVTRKAL